MPLGRDGDPPPKPVLTQVNQNRASGVDSRVGGSNPSRRAIESQDLPGGWAVGAMTSVGLLTPVLTPVLRRPAGTDLSTAGMLEYLSHSALALTDPSMRLPRSRLFLKVAVDPRLRPPVVDAWDGLVRLGTSLHRTLNRPRARRSSITRLKIAVSTVRFCPGPPVIPSGFHVVERPSRAGAVARWLAWQAHGKQ